MYWGERKSQGEIKSDEWSGKIFSSHATQKKGDIYLAMNKCSRNSVKLCVTALNEIQSHNKQLTEIIYKLNWKKIFLSYSISAITVVFKKNQLWSAFDAGIRQRLETIKMKLWSNN